MFQAYYTNLLMYKSDSSCFRERKGQAQRGDVACLGSHSLVAECHHQAGFLLLCSMVLELSSRVSGAQGRDSDLPLKLPQVLSWISAGAWQMCATQRAPPARWWPQQEDQPLQLWLNMVIASSQT